MRLQWDLAGSRYFETGLDRGVFYPKSGIGVPWNGLLSIKETDDNDSQTVLYIDGQKKVNQVDLGTFSASIEAYTYPDEMLPYDGFAQPAFSGQFRPPFNLSYRSLLGSDVEGTARGYLLHLVYNGYLKPASKDHASLNGDVDAETFNWDLSTTPAYVPGARPTSHIFVDSTKAYTSTMLALENLLYGTETTPSHFPSILEVLALFEATAIFKVTDNGDGTATISGPDEAVHMVTSDTAELTWPTVIQISEDTFQLSSL